VTVYLTRADAGLPPRPSTGTALTVAGVGTHGFTVHWPGEPGAIGTDRDPIRHLLQAYWTYHTTPEPAGHGWADIAYQAAVDQAGRVWDLRGVDRRSAANGDETVNTAWGALLLMVGSGEEPSQAMVTAVRDWRRTRWLARYPKAVHVVGHKDVRPDPTECPGPAVYAMVTDGTFVAEEPMTVFVLDASHYQVGLPVASLRSQGFVALILKATDGATYTDPSFAGYLAAGRKAGLMMAAYHFLHSATDAQLAAQAAHTAAVVPADIPVWIDVEGGSTRDEAYVYAAALRSKGRTAGGIYNSTQPAKTYGGWWRAAYGSDPAGSAPAAYKTNGGDGSPQWEAGTIRHPDLWQFCQHGRISGYSGDVDISAYRGTAAQLASTGWFWSPTDGSTDMPLTDDEFARIQASNYAAIVDYFEHGPTRDIGDGAASPVLRMIEKASSGARSGRIAAEAAVAGIGPISSRTSEAAGQLTGIADVVAGLADRPDPSAIDIGELATQLATYLPADLVSQLLDALGERIKAS
jgi:GH25 family lysozyme M1 (1,4-beta-N-acetylmuramidase)